MVAISKGWFKDAGFTDVTTKTFTGGARAGEALVADEIQLWTPGNLPPISMAHNGRADRRARHQLHRLRPPTSWSCARTPTSRRPRTCTGSRSASCRARPPSADLYYLAKHYNLDEKRLQVDQHAPARAARRRSTPTTARRSCAGSRGATTR
jgi:ABC-type nitrate/sulfonate/bicarbonate transport system substrate-binding protein